MVVRDHCGDRHEQPRDRRYEGRGHAGSHGTDVRRARCRDPEERGRDAEDGPHETHEGRNRAQHRQPYESHRELVTLLSLLLFQYELERLKLGQRETFARGGPFAERART